MAGLKSWKKNLRNMVDYPWESDGDSDHRIVRIVGIL